MKPFEKFIISEYSWNQESLTASFSYSFDDKELFLEKIDFSPLKDTEYFSVLHNDEATIKTLLSHLHIALGVSYYKLYPTKEILLKTFQLDKNQKKFWNTFYLKGLGEFFYRNQLDPRGLANFISENTSQLPKKEKIEFDAEKLLVLFWGGKDSLVSIELLKEKNERFDLFSFGKNFSLHELAEKPSWEKRLIIKRTLDINQINKLLEEGYYNGHLPITWIISFVSLVVGYLYGYRGVITSLEKSADEGNTVYCGMEINHQWSKSKEFEDHFMEYVKNYITDNFFAKSLLREWYEIKVVKVFAQYPHYFSSFSSCNRNFHLAWSQLSWELLWCWKCPKCAFVYTMLRAFLWKDEVNTIFNKDLFEDKELIPLFKELLGIDWIKPFECVWTNEEMVLWFWLILQKEPELESEIMKLFKTTIIPSMKPEEFEKLREKMDV